MVERFKVEPKKPSKLQIIIDEQTLAVAEENKKIRSSLYASDFGQCQRKVWFQFFPDEFAQEKLDPRILRVFANGNDVHERLSGYFKRIPELDFHDEVNVPRDELDVHGRCDGILKLDDQAVVVEFKSINARSVYEPKEEHVGQLTWYMDMFRRLRLHLKEDFGLLPDSVVREEDLFGVVALSGRTVSDLDFVEKWLLFTQGEIKGEIIYESKQMNSTHHFQLNYDSFKAAKVRLWFEQVKHYVDSKSMPLVKYDPDKYPCYWKTGKCAYFDICHGKKQ